MMITITSKRMMRILGQYGNKIPFLALHVGAVGIIVSAVFSAPPTATSFWLCVKLYYLRMFGLAVGFHRLFSHKSFKTSRVTSFLLAWLGCSATQRGPLWWTASHRKHHRDSDTPADPHSAKAYGFWWSHIGWVLSQGTDKADARLVKDW